jgi:hypothetical protein
MARTSSILTGVGIICLLFQFACKRGPTEPEVRNPREYRWTATQLQYTGGYNLSMYSIWGSGPTDVYVSGFSILGGQKGAMFHYDGKQWTSVSLPSPDYNYLWETTGFGPNDIWVAGSRLFPNPSLDSAAILHYDGTQWTQVLASHMGVRGLKSLGGNSSRDLFFGSRDGKIIRYNGASWSVDTLYLGLSVRDVGGDGTTIFAVGNTFRGALDDSVMCFQRNDSVWRLIDVQLSTQYSAVPRFGASNVYTPAGTGLKCLAPLQSCSVSRVMARQASLRSGRTMTVRWSITGMDQLGTKSSYRAG